MFDAIKDRVLSKAARLYCNTLLARYGSVQELHIDSAQRSMQIVCLLEGESAAIGVTVERYEVTREGGETFVQVMASRSTRSWVQHFLEDHIHGRKFPLPAWAAAAL